LYAEHKVRMCSTVNGMASDQETATTSPTLHAGSGTLEPL